MEQQTCACGCGNPVLSHEGKGRPSKYFHPNCRKRAQRMREAKSTATKIESDVTKLQDRIIQGDALSILQNLPDAFVQCCITSPPYYALRDYGVDGQIGLEATPEEYINCLVMVFREVRRVLQNTGTCWVNMGDTYSNDQKWGGHSSGKHQKGLHTMCRPRRYTGLPAKNLLGMPWRLAFALQSDGWILRSDIIWSKPSPLPEPVMDRPTKAHEYIFLLSKQSRYYYNADAIREPLRPKTFTTFGTKHRQQGNDALGLVKSDNWGRTIDERQPKLDAVGEVAGANKRTVWTVASQHSTGVHFATFPPKLIEPCILAGSHAGDLVLDPFMGSGTVAMVARQQGRSYLGIEISPDYVKLAEERLAGIPLSLWQSTSAEEVVS